METEAETPDEFDIEAAEAELEAPEKDWAAIEGKYRKAVNELKNVRASNRELKEFSSKFDVLDSDSRNAVAGWVQGLFSDDPVVKKEAAKWAVNQAKNFSGDSFQTILDELTPKQQEEVKESLQEAAEDGPITKADVQKAIQDAITQDRASQAEERRLAQQVAEVERTLGELGLPGKDKDGNIPLQTQMVLTIAQNQTKGDLAKAKELFEDQMAEAAKEYVQSKAGTPAGLSSETEGEVPSEGEKLTSIQRAERRLADIDWGAA